MHGSRERFLGTLGGIYCTSSGWLVVLLQDTLISSSNEETDSRDVSLTFSFCYETTKCFLSARTLKYERHSWPSPPESKEDLNIHLQGAYGIPQLKILQHARMQYAKAPNHSLLSAQPQMNRRRMPRQKRLIVHLADPIRAFTHPLAIQSLFASHESRFQHQHDAIHEPVYDFETASLGEEGGGEVALIAAFALEGLILEGYVADFEDLDRDAVVFVFFEGLEEAREERRADDLVFCCFRVGQPDGSVAVVDAIEESKILCMRAEDEGEDFRPACHCRLDSYNVAEFVDGERLGDCG